MAADLMALFGDEPLPANSAADAEPVAVTDSDSSSKVSQVRLFEVKEVREPTRSDLDGREHWKRSTDAEIGQSGERVVRSRKCDNVTRSDLDCREHWKRSTDGKIGQSRERIPDADWLERIELAAEKINGVAVARRFGGLHITAAGKHAALVQTDGNHAVVVLCRNTTNDWPRDEDTGLPKLSIASTAALQQVIELLQQLAERYTQ